MSENRCYVCCLKREGMQFHDNHMKFLPCGCEMGLENYKRQKKEREEFTYPPAEQESDMQLLKDIMIKELRKLDEELARHVCNTEHYDAMHAELQKSQREMLKMIQAIQNHQLQIGVSEYASDIVKRVIELQENHKKTAERITGLEVCNATVDDDLAKSGQEFNKLDEHVQERRRWHEDHYRNHESLKTEFQLIVQAQDGMADHNERIAALEQHTNTNQDSTIMPRIDGHALQIYDLEKKIEALSKNILTNWDELQRPINHQAVQMGILRERIKALEDFNIKLKDTWSADIEKYQAIQTKTDDELIALGKLLDVLNMKLNLHGERIQTIEEIFEVKHYPNKTFTYSVGEMPLTSKDIESDVTSNDTKPGMTLLKAIDAMSNGQAVKRENWHTSFTLSKGFGAGCGLDWEDLIACDWEIVE